MPLGALPKITAKLATEITSRCKLSDEAQPFLKPGQSPGDFLEALMTNVLWIDAIQFLAQALPKRETVWWGCSCVRTMAGTAPANPTTAAMQSAEQWVSDPNEDRRRAAEAAAEKTGLETAAGCLAFAAFLSGGSLAPKTVEAVVPPADDLTGRAVAGAITLAAVVSEPEKAEERFKNFVERGIEIARGKNLWK